MCAENGPPKKISAGYQNAILTKLVTKSLPKFVFVQIGNKTATRFSFERIGYKRGKDNVLNLHVPVTATTTSLSVRVPKDHSLWP